MMGEHGGPRKEVRRECGETAADPAEGRIRVKEQMLACAFGLPRAPEY